MVMHSLTPTTITDKNGRITTVHKKAEKVGSRTLQAIPQVALPTTATISAEDAFKAIFPDVHPDLFDDAVNKMMSAIKLLNQHSPKALETIVDKVGTGSKRGQRDVRKRSQSVIDAIVHAMDGRLPLESDSQFVNSISSYFDAVRPSTIRQYWNCLNVMDESGFLSDETPGVLDNMTRREFNTELPKLDLESQNDAFWRGATAFAMLDRFPSPYREDLSARENYSAKREFYREAKKFIDYAGKHKDIGLVIRTAKERGIFNVRDIREIISRGNEAPAIRSGVL